jgi:anti-sigma factor RsiW
MTCREFADVLDDYVAGALRGEPLAIFERHLALCPNCDHYLAQYRATIALGRGAFADEDAPVPADVPEHLITAILAARSR